ncbi:MAG TPA: cytidylate kinase-like family protein [Terriglobales bacterium]|jgi:cytidylate kinase
MFRIITIEREYGSGAAAIAAELSRRLGWKLWDQELTQEIAKLANVEQSVVQRCEERIDSRFQRLAKVFWRGSFERSANISTVNVFDTDRWVALGTQVFNKVAAQGNCIFVGRGAPYLLRGRPDAFHVFLYAPRAEKFRRVLEQGKNENEANELLDTVDRDRVEFVRHYFNADWPTRALYHIMLNTVMGDENVLAAIQQAMANLEKKKTA